MPDSKKKIVIIGGGAAGVFTAYLLQKQAHDQFDITILEKEPVIGGHAQSVSVGVGPEEVHIDYGAQFFSETAQPEYCAMLREEGFFAKDQIVDVDMGMTLWDGSEDRLLFRIPNSMEKILEAAGKEVFAWLFFAVMTMKANEFFKQGGWTTTFGEWIASLHLPHIDKGLKDAFKAEVVRPLMYQFGLVPPDEMDKLSARFVLYYYLGSLPKDPAMDVLKGEKLRPFAVYNSKIGLDGILKSLIQEYELVVEANETVASIARQGVRYVVTDASGTSFEADELVFATNPKQARDILPAESDYEEVRSVLARMVFLKVLVRIQRTASPAMPRYMPTQKEQWSGSNVIVMDTTPENEEPTDYRLTIWFGALREDKSLAAEFFKSWGSPNLSSSEGPNHHDHHHYLMEGTPEFLAARTELVEQHQGVDSRWFVGGYLVDYASQNAALRSASIVVRKILAKHGVAPARPEFLERQGDVVAPGHEIFAALELPEPLHFIAAIKEKVLQEAPQNLRQEWSNILTPQPK